MKENDSSTISNINEISTGSIKTNEKAISKGLDIIPIILGINTESNDILSIVNNLNIFEYNLQFISNVEYVLTNDVLLVLQKLAKKDNIPINIILCRIYVHT